MRTKGSRNKPRGEKIWGIGRPPSKYEAMEVIEKLEYDKSQLSKQLDEYKKKWQQPFRKEKGKEKELDVPTMLLEYLSEIKALKSDLQREKLIHEEETYWLRREIADLRKLLSSELGRLPISSIRNLLQKEFPNSI